MTERPRRFDDEAPEKIDFAPETDNSEQEDESGQAHTVAEEALNRTDEGLGDSEKVSSGDDSDDAPDLVDRMKQMDSSGRIDMGAYRGERNDDDEDGMLGEAGEEDEG